MCLVFQVSEKTATTRTVTIATTISTPSPADTITWLWKRWWWTPTSWASTWAEGVPTIQRLLLLTHIHTPSNSTSLRTYRCTLLLRGLLAVSREASQELVELEEWEHSGLEWVDWVENWGRVKTTRSAESVATELSATTSTPSRANPAKPSFVAMHRKAWWVISSDIYYINCNLVNVTVNAFL